MKIYTAARETDTRPLTVANFAAYDSHVKSSNLCRVFLFQKHPVVLLWWIIRYDACTYFFLFKIITSSLINHYFTEPIFVAKNKIKFFWCWKLFFCFFVIWDHGDIPKTKQWKILWSKSQSYKIYNLRICQWPLLKRKT